MIQVGDTVEKKSGYKFPGEVVAKFTKLDGETTRYVVECTAEGVEGILHIYREEQLEKTND